MSGLESTIKGYARALGVEVVGLAGPERLEGPPSLDPAYSMPGARSIVSMALPMDVTAIYDFLSKSSPAPHNLDQLRTYQRLQHLGARLAERVRSLGYEAMALPLSADYRRSPYVFSLHPAFSHRFGAIAAGIAAQGWSGNVMTREYGAAVYLGTVVTDAVLESDPPIEPRHFLDSFCTRCRRCAKACPSRMFSSSESEFVLLDGALHERGARRNIDLCNISCFGLHSLSADRKWTNWGRHWIDDWLDSMPDPSKRVRLLGAMLKKGLTTGDSTQRFDILRRVCATAWPEKDTGLLPALKDFPEDEPARYETLARFVNRVGVTGIDDYPVPMVCGHCALVCGPTLEETARRYETLADSGLVVPGSRGAMVNVATFEEALEIRRRYPQRPGAGRIAKDIAATAVLWHRHYFGLEPMIALEGRAYQRRLRTEIAEMSERKYL